MLLTLSHAIEKNFMLLIGTLIIMFGQYNAFTADKPIATIRIEPATTIPAGAPVRILLDKNAVQRVLVHIPLCLRANNNIYDLPAQIISEDNRQWLVWIAHQKLEAKQAESFRLYANGHPTTNLVFPSLDETGLELRSHQRQYLRYEYKPIPPPAGKDPLFTRSAFIHPLWTPSGISLTRIHPSDHMHHMGFWHPWTKTEFEGRHVDFWNLGDGQGTVRFVKFKQLTTGPVCGGFLSEHLYVDLTDPGCERTALREQWDIIAWAPGRPDQQFQIIDLTIHQRCAGDNPLTILQYRYGGFGFRATADWHNKNSTILTSEGKTRENGNGERARWCLIQGETDRGHCGVLFIGHPENFNYPEPVRIWPVNLRDVYFGFCPVVDRPWELQPGQIYSRRYRIITFDGSMDASTAERFFQQFTVPPAIQVKWDD